jgi:subtilase family serine protease
MNRFVSTIGLLSVAGFLSACAASDVSVLQKPALESRARVAALGIPGGALASNVRRVCEPRKGEMHCTALMRTDVTGQAALVAGLGPADLQTAYALPSATNGTGQRIAIVDAYDDPKAESDLGVYRSTFGLPPCTTANGCFAKVNENGMSGPLPHGRGGWAEEISLDLDMVSAACPNCAILLVESSTSTLQDLGISVDTAVLLGANAVSNSYTGNGAKGAQYYDHPGVVITAGSGDAGSGEIGAPAVYPTVIAIGGTSLYRAHDSRGWTETVWSGTGSGCSKQAKPYWQLDPDCPGRMVNDVAAVADPNTGVAVYDTYREPGWIVLGGTSAGAPLIAAVYGLAGNGAAQNAAMSLYVNSTALNDITTGSNGTCEFDYFCHGEPGYDGPTGNGTPNGIAAF